MCVHLRIVVASRSRDPHARPSEAIIARPLPPRERACAFDATPTATVTLAERFGRRGTVPYLMPYNLGHA
jgi:hypothetical protein